MAKIPWMVRLGLRDFNRGTLVAAGAEVDLKDSSAIQSVLNRRQQWQKQAFDALDACGELSYGTYFLAGLIGRLTLFVAEQPEFKDSEPAATTNKEAISVLERLGTKVERSEIQRDLTTQILVPGECYLVGRKEPDGDEVWEVRSIEEIQASGAAVTLRNAPNDEKPIVLNPDTDTWIRIWHRSPRYASQATSHVRPILDAIDELIWWDAAARARAKNRLADAGAWGIPNDIEAPEEKDDDPKLSGAQRFAKRFFQSMLNTISNPGSSSAAVPLVFTYPANDLRKSGMEYIPMKRTSDDLLEKRTDRALKRIAQGMNLPVEVLFGMGRAAHWTGGEIEQSVFREHVAPLAELIVNALTVAYLRPILREMGVDNPEKYLIWYDASQLIARPDMSQAADKGAELLMIGPPAWRRTRGFSESDKPTPEEEKRMLEILTITRGRTGPVNPTGVSQTPPPDNPNAQPTKPAAPSEHPPKEQPAVTNKTKGQPVLASVTNGHTDVLLAQLQILGDEKIRRALEKAGNKLRTRANKNERYKTTIKGAATEKVASLLGRDAVVKLGCDDLFDGSFDTVPAQFVALCRRVPELSKLDLSVLNQAGRVFTQSLLIAASEALYKPPTYADYILPQEKIESAMKVVASAAA